MSTYRIRTDRAWKMVHELIDSAVIPIDDNAKLRAAAVLHRELYLHDEAERGRRIRKAARSLQKGEEK